VTGPDGRFVFERVIPGKGGLGRNIMTLADEEATEVASSCSVGIDPSPAPTYGDISERSSSMSQVSYSSGVSSENPQSGAMCRQ